MSEPLNPALFRELERYYHDVQIVSPGIEIRWRLVPYKDEEGKQRFRREVIDSGEEYSVRCKKCRDHRPRLSFNHRWGVYDPETSSRNLWLANCFNEQCYDEYDAQLHLYEMLLGRLGNRRTIVVNPGRPNKAGKIEEIPFRGDLVRLDVLKKTRRDHQAIVYLEERGFDVDMLARMYGVSYASHSYFSLAQDRIIIPIYYQSKMVGWQARFVGDNYFGTPFNKAGVPKYWTSPGFKRRFVAYNFERALQHQTVIITEGPADVWNAGPMAMGVLGKTMSQELRKKLVDALADRPDVVVVVALDPVQDVMSKRRGKPHHLDVLYQQLYQPLGGRVLLIRLPDEFDCGSLDRKILRQMIRDEADKQGMPVSFSRPVVPG